MLVVAAHPDDVDFGAAGTVAAFTDAGVTVRYVIVTDGDAGGSDRAVARTQMAELRRAEQTEAAARVGVREVVFLGYPDGRVAASLELRRDLSREIRAFRPQRVLAPSPDRWWERIQASHPDHLAVGEAAVCAVYPDARNPFAHTELLAEGLEPHTVQELWLMAAPVRDLVVETTETFERKMAALCCHRSQIATCDEVTGWMRAAGARSAEEAGLGPDTLAESFRLVKTG